MRKLSFSKFGLAALALAFLSCSPETPKLVPGEKIPDLPPPSRKTKSGATSEVPAIVDILFIIDDSGSMGIHQNNLANNISLFTDELLLNKNVDYHVGVINTSDEPGIDFPDPLPDLPGSPGGILKGAPKFVTRTTPDANNVLRNNLRVGDGGSAVEQFFVPGMKALSAPLSQNENAGFLRPDAFIAIMVLTDTDDQSSGYSPRNFYDFLLSIKGNNPAKILTYGGIIPAGSGCKREQGELDPNRLMEFFSMTKGGTFTLCDPSFGAKLAGFAKDLVRKTASKVLLDSVPDLSTVQVTYGSQVIPQDTQNGWYYIPSENSIDFGRSLVWTNQPAGTAVEVSYLDKTK